MHSLLLGMALLTTDPVATPARAPSDASADAPADAPAPISRGDLFPGRGHVNAGAATGLPYFAIAEVGVGLTDGIAVGAFVGVTPSVWAFGLRPRFRVQATERTSFVLVSPIVYYPAASAPGILGMGREPWLLTRTELFVDRAIGERWHAAGGMGIFAVAATKAIGDLLTGRDVAMPAYDGDPKATKGFAGGIWNSLAARGSYALQPSTHLFAEASLVMKGVKPADDVGGPPVVFNVGVQHAF